LKFLIATLKETPADAQVISHQLMLRSGMIRKVAAGLYNWLPLGLRVLRKVENIVRDEMDKAGAQEVLNDRHGREFCFGPTHEEVITDLVSNEIRSYRQLPANFYQIQTKFRDERRPRFGVMRAREFIMKDAYSFHMTQDSLQETYDVMFDTYNNIFTRLGLGFAPVEADTGSIGGSSSHEFHVLADSGEDAIAVCEKYNYAANVELAEALPIGGERAAASAEMTRIDTPQQRTIQDIVKANDIDIKKTIKTLLVKGAEDTEHDVIALVF